MRRILSPLLIGVGVFLLVAAVLVRVYAYPALSKVPTNQDSVTELTGTDVSIFSTSLLEPTTLDLFTSSATKAQKVDDVPEGCVVWATTTSTRIGDPEGIILSRSVDQSTFDETSGAACEGGPDFTETTAGDREPIQREGQINKFPFDTQKKDYLWWDSSIREATPAQYVGTDEIQGLEVYTFEQVIEPTVVQTREIPGSVFGLEDPSVEAEVVYGMTRTFQVEPNTGVVIDRTEQRDQVLRYDGTDVDAFVGTVGYSDETVKANVDEYSGKAMLLGGARLLFPLLMGLLGLVLVVVGAMLGRRSEQPAHEVRREKVTTA